MPILGIMASSTPAVGDYQSIATVTLSSAQTTVSFTSIPSTYSHLQIRSSWRGNRATYPVSGTNMRFNSDSSANYAWHELNGSGASATTGASYSATELNVGQPGTSVTHFAASVIDILDYANTNKNKTTRTITGLDLNGTIAGYPGAILLASGLWINTNAITSISFTPADGSQWQQYSSFALYGIK